MFLINTGFLVDVVCQSLSPAARQNFKTYIRVRPRNEYLKKINNLIIKKFNWLHEMFE